MTRARETLSLKKPDQMAEILLKNISPNDNIITKRNYWVKLKN